MYCSDCSWLAMTTLGSVPISYRAASGFGFQVDVGGSGRTPGEVVVLDVVVLPVSELHRVKDVVLQLFLHIEKAEPFETHQPLVAAGTTEIEPQGARVRGDAAGRLDHVGVQVRAVCVGELAERLGVGHKSIDVGHERDGNEPRVVVDQLFEIVEVGAPVALFNDPDLEPCGFELFIDVGAAMVVKLVGHDVATPAMEPEPRSHDILAGQRARDKGDLGRARVDDSTVEHFELLDLRLEDEQAIGARSAYFVRKVLFDHARRGGAQRMNSSIVHVGLILDPGKVLAKACEVRIGSGSFAAL